MSTFIEFETGPLREAIHEALDLHHLNARDRRDRWPHDGYGTTVAILHISRWWLLRANWSDSCE